MKLKTFMLACILMVPLGLIYAQGTSGSQGNSGSPPDHDGTHGQGHEEHQATVTGMTSTTPARPEPAE